MTYSSSPSNPGERRGPILAVIDTPAGPPGWEDARAQLVRIVDPLGRAVAWLAPACGGRCVGFAIRPSGERGTEWMHVFHSADVPARRELPQEVGCGAQCMLAAEEPDRGPPSNAPWQLVERDPTAVMLTATLRGDATSDRRGRDDRVDLRFSAALDDGTLTLSLMAENRATNRLRVHLGLQLSFVGSLLSDATGSTENHLRGESIRRDTTEKCVDLPRGAVARLGRTGTPVSVGVTPVTGVSQLCYVAPGERKFALLRAVADAPSGGVSLRRGAAFQMAIALRAMLD